MNTEKDGLTRGLERMYDLALEHAAQIVELYATIYMFRGAPPEIYREIAAAIREKKTP